MSMYMGLAFFSVVISSFGQVLLKKSSGEKKERLIFEYLNLKVLAAYGINLLCMFIMIYAYTGMYYRYGAVIGSLSYLIIMLLSRIFLGEKITRRRVLGNLVIVAGVLIFTFG